MQNEPSGGKPHLRQAANLDRKCLGGGSWGESRGVGNGPFSIRRLEASRWRLRRTRQAMGFESVFLRLSCAIRSRQERFRSAGEQIPMRAHGFTMMPREASAAPAASFWCYYSVIGRPMRSTEKTRIPMFHRRKLLNSLCAGGAWEILGGKPLRSGTPDTVRRFRIWDNHCHLHSVPGDTPEQRMEVLIRCADRLGIERLFLSQGYSADLHPTPDQLREENDRVCVRCGASPNGPTGRSI